MIQNKGSIHLKLEHIVVSENTSDEFNIGHCQIKVKVTARLLNFSSFTTIQTVKSYMYILALAHVRKLLLGMSVKQIIMYKMSMLILFCSVSQLWIMDMLGS